MYQTDFKCGSRLVFFFSVLNWKKKVFITLPEIWFPLKFSDCKWLRAKEATCSNSNALE